MCKLLLYSIIIIEINSVLAVTVSKIQVNDNVVTEKGTDVTLVCTVQQFSTSTIIYVYKAETRIFNSDDELDRCVKGDCFSSGYLIDNKYTITADSSHVYIAIKDLSITQDGKWWTCANSDGTSQQQLELIVYASPISIILSGDVTDGDLQSNSVTIYCQANCVHPAPTSFQFFYKKTTTNWLSYKDVSAVASTSSCSDGEKKYTGTLQLPRYTVWPLQPQNKETTVQFQCRLSFPTLSSPLQSTESGDVRYAVKVASVVFKYTGVIPSNDSTVYTIIGFPETFTCTPSISRPAATIVWYVDSQEIQRGTSTEFKYTPIQADNRKVIYCEAFNIQVESDAVISQKLTLQVIDLESSTSFFVDGHLGQNVVTIDEHEAVNMTCSVDTQPASAITITFERKPLTETNGAEMLTFTRRSVECTHAAVYMCTAGYYGHKTSKYLTLDVNCSPRPLRQTKQNVTTKLNASVTLSFTVIAYPEPGHKGFQWFKEDSLRWTPLRTNEDIAISSSELQSNLTILNVSPTDYGQYRVSVKNSIGSYEQYLFISKVGESSGTESDRMLGKASTNSTQTSVIVGVILGIVCVVLAVYASYVTVLYRRLTKKNENTSATGQTNKSLYINQTFRPGHEEIEDREYEHPMPIEQSAMTSSSTGQYTDLNSLTGEERTAYETLQI